MSDPEESVGVLNGQGSPSTNGRAQLSLGTGAARNLATTTKVLADNRQQAINAVGQLGRLAHVQNEVLDRYHSDLDRQIKQVDAILAVAATQTQQLGTVVDFLNEFTYALPKAIPVEFTQVYMWAIPCINDSRSPSNCLQAPGC